MLLLGLKICLYHYSINWLSLPHHKMSASQPQPQRSPQTPVNSNEKSPSTPKSRSLKKNAPRSTITENQSVKKHISRPPEDTRSMTPESSSPIRKGVSTEHRSKAPPDHLKPLEFTPSNPNTPIPDKGDSANPRAIKKKRPSTKPAEPQLQVNEDQENSKIMTKKKSTSQDTDPIHGQVNETQEMLKRVEKPSVKSDPDANQIQDQPKDQPDNVSQKPKKMMKKKPSAPSASDVDQLKDQAHDHILFAYIFGFMRR